MRIETARLVIRTFEPRDSDAWITMINDPEVGRYTPSDDRVATPELYQGVMERRQAQERERGYAMWAVEAKATGACIGQCGLYQYVAEGKEPVVEIGYHYPPASWNKGYGTEAAVAVLTYGFGTVGLDRVIALVVQENVGAWRRRRGCVSSDWPRIMRCPTSRSMALSARGGAHHSRRAHKAHCARMPPGPGCESGLSAHHVLVPLCHRTRRVSWLVLKSYGRDPSRLSVCLNSYFPGWYQGWYQVAWYKQRRKPQTWKTRGPIHMYGA